MGFSFIGVFADSMIQSANYEGLIVLCFLYNIQLRTYERKDNVSSTNFRIEYDKIEHLKSLDYNLISWYVFV